MDICLAVGGFVLMFLAFLYFIYWLRKKSDSGKRLQSAATQTNPDGIIGPGNTTEPHDV